MIDFSVDLVVARLDPALPPMAWPAKDPSDTITATLKCAVFLALNNSLPTGVDVSADPTLMITAYGIVDTTVWLQIAGGLATTPLPQVAIYLSYQDLDNNVSNRVVATVALPIVARVPATFLPAGPVAPKVVVSFADLPMSPNGLLPGEIWNNGDTIDVVSINNFPTSPAGLAPGTLWNNGGNIAIA